LGERQSIPASRTGKTERGCLQEDLPLILRPPAIATDQRHSLIIRHRVHPRDSNPTVPAQPLQHPLRRAQKLQSSHSADRGLG
jgi:hypothetical protein